MPRRPARRRLAAATADAVLAGLVSPALSSPAQAAAPGVPGSPTTVLSSPAKVVELRWSPVAGAVSYAVQIGTDPYWSDEADIHPLSTVSTRLTLPVWLPHADYLWRVAAVGADGARGGWSPTLDVDEQPLAAVTFTRDWDERPVPLPQRLAPTDPVQDDPWLPTFRWTPVRTASEYQLQVSTDATFLSGPSTDQAHPVLGSCFTTRTSVTPFNKQKAAANPGAGHCAFDGLPPGQQLYWRVRALDQVADQVEELVTTPVVDSGVSHLPPADPGKLDTTDCPKASTSVTEACTPAHPVEKGDWSRPEPFTLSAWPAIEGDYRDLGPVPTRALPADLCTSTGSCRDVPTIDWAPVPDATWYRVYIALDREYSNIQEIAETPATAYTPTVQWRDSGVMSSYYYAVQACTTQGCGEVVASPPSFRKASVPVRLRSPQVTRTDTVLAWDHYADVLDELGAAASEAAAYRVQVTRAGDTSFANPVEDVVTDHTTHASRDKAYGEGSFLWRVQAVDASGHKLRWSAPGSFTRDHTAPVVASTSRLTTIAPQASLTAKLSEPVTGVSAATAYLLPTAAGASPVPARVSLSGTTVTVDPTAPLPVGGTYTLVLTGGIRDLAGNALATVKKAVTVDPVVDDGSAALTYAGSWSTLSSSMVADGTYRRASAAGATATVSTSGTGVRVYGCRGPSGGRFELRVDGVARATVDTYRSYSSCGTLGEVTGLRAGTHTVQVKVLGTRTSASGGTGVGLAGLRAL